jgi:putative transcriptional regulator
MRLKCRRREKLSQPVFAEYLNASASTIKKWETREKHPTGPALKLLNLTSDKRLSILV